MSDVIVTRVTTVTDPAIRELSRELAEGVILAAHKAVAHHAEPGKYLLPKDPGALEHAFLGYLRARPLERQQKLVARVMPQVSQRQLPGLEGLDLAAPTPLFAARTARSRLGAVARGARAQRQAPVVEDGQKGFRQQSSSDVLSFALLGVRCIDETDGFAGSEAGADEIELTGALIDAGGATSPIGRVVVGSFGSDGVVKNFDPPRTLGAVDLRSGSGWPKTFNLVLTLIEADNGDLPKLVNSLFEEVRKRVQDLVKGAAGIVPADIGEVVVGAIDDVLDRVFKFIKDVWEDDVFRPMNLAFTFASADERFDGGRADSGPLWAEFKGHGGTYRVAYRAQLAIAADAAIDQGAVLYESANFGGKATALKVGRHDVAGLDRAGAGNDKISALKVGRGLRVIAYEHAGFGGNARVYTGAVAQLGDFNDKISSIVIEPLAVSLFQHANFAGASQSFAPGRHDVGALKVGNDAASSVLVPPGMRVTLFEHGGFKGRKKVIQADTTYVGDDFNDVVSSLIVELV